jgi:hypothetical protein
VLIFVGGVVDVDGAKWATSCKYATDLLYFWIWFRLGLFVLFVFFPDLAWLGNDAGSCW